MNARGEQLPPAKWLYLPGVGWERVVRRATQADVDAAAGTPVLLEDDPMLVPPETLPGRDHYEFRASEQPPWQWSIGGTYPVGRAEAGDCRRARMGTRRMCQPD